jgi:predicted Zn-dependent protease
MFFVTLLKGITMRRLGYSLILGIIFFLGSCGESSSQFNLFSIEDDKKLGKQISDYIESDTSGITVLQPEQHPEAYSYLNNIVQYILNSEQVKHKDDFEWRVRIIQDDTTLNAFATPGGYIYVYSGLIKFLDSEDQLAGVLAHEIAHADQRHSTAMLTKVYGVEFIFSLILGANASIMRDITSTLLSLNFSRGAEEEADKYSVMYLCQDSALYDPDGVAGFFIKMEQEGKQNQQLPEFLSTHPNPPGRIEKIQSQANELECNVQNGSVSGYEDFKKRIPG